MTLNSRSSLIARLKRGRRVRRQFVESHIAKTLAFQVRALRDRLGWTQKELGEAAGSNQNGVYRLESGTGRPTLTTLKNIAAACDVALVVRFVPFSELVDWVSGTPRVDRGLRTGAILVPPFTEEFSERTTTVEHRDNELTSLSEVPIRMVKAEATEVKGMRTSSSLAVKDVLTDDDATVNNAGESAVAMEALG